MGEDWSPLAGENPIPGDPGRVAALARRLGHTGDVIRGQSNRLRGVKAGWWKGPAADNFTRHQEKLPPLLDDVADRYEQVASALDAYHPVLDDAQNMAREARDRAKIAQADIERALQGIAAMQAHAQNEAASASQWNAANPKEPPRSPAPWSGPNWHYELQEAEGDMEAARALLEDAKAVRDGAAERAAGTITAAVDDSLRNEGGFSGFLKRTGNWLVHTALPVLADITSWAAAILGIAALFFPVLAPFALAAAALSLALDVAMVATGQGSWENVMIGVVGLATFGVGRVAGVAARAARSARAGVLANAVKGARVGGKWVSSTGRTVSGATAQSTLVKQLRTVEAFYKPARTGWRAILPDASEWRAAAKVFRDPVKTVRGSWDEQLASMTGRLDPAIARVPAIQRWGDIAPDATKQVRHTLTFEAVVSSKGVEQAREASGSRRAAEEAEDRGEDTEAIPAHP